jgi:hypothetical protein
MPASKIPTTRSCLTRDLVTQAHAKCVGQFLAKHNIEFTRMQISERTGFHELGEIRDMVFHLRLDPPDDGAAHGLILCEHALLLDERGGREHIAILAGDFHIGGPVREFAIKPVDLGMRRHPDDAVTQFFLKAVHDRHHDNQGHYAHRDARNRGKGNKGD